MRLQIKRSFAMFTVSRFAKSSALVLLAATLTTAAHAGGHGGSTGSSGASGPAHSSNARVVSGLGNQTVSKGSTAHGHGPWTGAWSKVNHLPTAPQGAAK
jgi:hypothetical protein